MPLTSLNFNALTLSIVLIDCCIIKNMLAVRTFPEGFLFGTATASYQIEGGWNIDGKSESIWDHFAHNYPNSIEDKSNGDVASDSYHQYKRDVEMVRELGLDFYRFSLSWTRILPTGILGKINEAGVQYYNNLINEMLKYNIKPMVTLYHWDLPQKLQNLGGWTNPNIVDWYADYAKVAFENFGDRVKHWFTINEPYQICHYGYGRSILAPAINDSGFSEYICTKYLLLAHAKAYHLYDEVFRPVQKGNVSIIIHGMWCEPETDDDVAASQNKLNFEIGQYAHPVFSKNGDYPQIMKERISIKSIEQGFARSRLPELTQEEVETLKGTSDFFGLNHYSTYMVAKKYFDNGVVSFNNDVGVTFYQKDEWLNGSSSWLKVVPQGFPKILAWIKEEYNNPPVMVTENGYSSHGGLDDDDRANYLKQYLNALLDAIDDGCNVIGYAVWTLMDNFEWDGGYIVRFGLYEVDIESAQRTRTPRKSAFVYKQIVRTRTLDLHYEPDANIMTIDEGH